MAYSDEKRPYGRPQDTEKVSMLLRSQFQDIVRSFNDKRIKVLFPAKMIDGVDIGEIAHGWARDVVTALRFYIKYGKYGAEIDADKEFELLFEIYMLYHKNINLDTSKYWHIRWMEEGIPAFTRWLDGFPATARGAAADELEKKEKTKQDIEEWWR